MRAMCSITRALILIRRSRIVANSAVASASVRAIAARTPCISQNAEREGAAVNGMFGASNQSFGTH
jgi:hypothetical protein